MRWKYDIQEWSLTVIAILLLLLISNISTADSSSESAIIKRPNSPTTVKKHQDSSASELPQLYGFGDDVYVIIQRMFSFKGGEKGENWPKLQLDWRLVVAIVLGSVGASLCSAGGVGGGGLFIPIFNLLLGFDVKSAAALSNFMILGGSLANVGWNIQQVHPHQPEKPLIDFDVALLLQPNMLLGISVGVICNVLLPSWFITLEFVLILGYTTIRSLQSGLIRWKNETEFVKKRASKSVHDEEEQRRLEDARVFDKSSSFNVVTGCILEEGDVASEEVLKRLNSRTSRQNSLKQTQTRSPPVGHNQGSEPLLGNSIELSQWSFPVSKLLILALVWFAFFAVQILRGGKSGAIILNLRPCGTGYWLLTALQVPLALVLTLLSASHLHQPHRQAPPELLEEWDLIGPRAFIIFPGMALLAGFLGGMLGIGGGMILNPMLIEIGMHPQLTAATCAFMVFFSSSMSVVQFWLLGRIPMDFAILFAVICLVSSLIGLHVVQHAITKFGRASIIVFSVSGVLGISAILTTIFGGLDVWEQYVYGAYMGFHTPC